MFDAYHNVLLNNRQQLFVKCISSYWIHSGNLQKPSPAKPSHGTPQGRGEEVGHETPGRDTERETKEMSYTRRDGEDGHGQKTVAFLGRWPMLPASKQA